MTKPKIKIRWDGDRGEWGPFVFKLLHGVYGTSMIVEVGKKPAAKASFGLFATVNHAKGHASRWIGYRLAAIDAEMWKE